METERIGAHVVLTRMRGHLTRVLAERRFEQFRSTLLEVEQPTWIIEQLEVTGFDPGAVTAGARWFGTFKDRGGGQVIVVTTLSAAQMVAASLAFAVHAKISSCETLQEAYDRAGLVAVVPRPSIPSFKSPKSH
jgi:hypothetical protein